MTAATLNGSDPLASLESEIASLDDARERRDGQLTFTDLGNAERFIRSHRRRVRYAHEMDWWYRLQPDASLWQREAAAILELAKQTAIAIGGEVRAMASDDEAAKAAAKHHAYSQSGRGLREMVRVAQSDHRIRVKPAEFDADPWIFNTPSGVIELRPGGGESPRLRAWNGNDLLTKVGGVRYEPDAAAPRWRQFLDEVCNGDAMKIAYLQRLSGMFLTGDTSEQKWYAFVGAGANGKSTFLRMLQAAMGDYAMTTRPETLLIGRGDSVGNDIACLQGARLVCASEAPSGRRLNEALIKQLTGGDTVQARFLFREHFEFVPQLKLVLATNYRPQLNGADNGIGRRTIEVPWTQQFMGKQSDPDLVRDLTRELPGILAWAVTGCHMWQMQGLGSTPEIIAASRAYLEDMDPVQTFIEDCCIVAVDQRESAGSLYRCYKAWCAQVGEMPESGKSFASKLGQKGFAATRTATDRYRSGIKLRIDSFTDAGRERWEF